IALRLVHAVAGHTAQVALIVLAAFPQRVRGAVVARGARRADVVGPGVLVEGTDQRLIAALGVRLAGTVAAFASMCGRRRARVRGESVRSALIRLVMAPQTGVLPDVFTGRRLGGARRRRLLR